MDASSREFLARFAHAMINHVQAAIRHRAAETTCELRDREQRELDILKLLKVVKPGDKCEAVLDDVRQTAETDADAALAAYESSYREIITFAMILDGKSLTEIDAYIRERDVEQRRIRCAIRQEIDRVVR